MKKLVYLFWGLAFITGCKSPKNANSGAKGITKANWGKVYNTPVELYTLTNKNGVELKISTYGGIITSWEVPDKNGKKASILLGFDSVSKYLAPPPYFGALVGRYGNRIAKGEFILDGKEYQLATNDGSNHLHGGIRGFDKVIWKDSTVADSVPTLILNYLSKDGEEGYPGNLNVTVKYSLTDDNELVIEYNAETDKPTPINLTQHNYYNLTGDPTQTILNHTLILNADKYTPVDSTLIPTGELKNVHSTPFDFTTPHKIGERIAQVKSGYDHNWVLNKTSDGLQLAATAIDSTSGRKLEVYTDQPGIQFYSGNFLDGKLKTNDGKPINKYAGLCLETQHFPNSPNQPNFPNTILKPGEKYHSISEYKFSIIK